MNREITANLSYKLPKSFNSKRLIPCFTYLILFCFLGPKTSLFGQTTQTLSSPGIWAGPEGVTPVTYYVYKNAIVQSDDTTGKNSYVETNTSNALTFKESDKATGSHLAFRGEDVSSSEFFRAYLCTSSGKIADGVAVAFNSSYQNRIDANDAVKMSNTGENLGLRRDGIILAIEARSPVTVNDTLYFDLKNLARADYQFRFSPQYMQNEPLIAFLADKYLKTETEVSLAGTTSLNFTINSDAASYAADRFLILFKQAAILPVTFVSIKATKKDKNVLVSWHVENETNMQQYEVENSIDGNHFEKVATIEANNSGSGNYHCVDKYPTHGNNFYRVRSMDKATNVVYSPVVKVFTGNLKPGISVYPNPITDGNIHLKFTNQPEGRYGVRLLNYLGQVLLSNKIEFAGVNGSKDLQWNFKLPRGVYQLEITKPDESVEVVKVMKVVN